MSPSRLIACAVLTVSIASLGGSAQEKKPDFEVPDDVAFRTADILSEGTRMAAEVFAPKDPKTDKLPTIVMSHGWGGTAKMLRPDAIAFARAGYLVVAFDYRGWGNSDSRLILAGGKPTRKDGKLVAEVKEVREVVNPIDQTTDILNAIHWAAGEKQCDPDRIGLWGSSFSGGHVVYVAARDPRVKAFVSQVGSMDGRWAVTNPQMRAYTYNQSDRSDPRPDRLSPARREVRHLERRTGDREVPRLRADRGHRPLHGLRQALHHRREGGALRQQGQRDPGPRAGDWDQEARDDPGHQALRGLQRGPRPRPEGSDRLVRRSTSNRSSRNHDPINRRCLSTRLRGPSTRHRPPCRHPTRENRDDPSRPHRLPTRRRRRRSRRRRRRPGSAASPGRGRSGPRRTRSGAGEIRATGCPRRFLRYSSSPAAVPPKGRPSSTTVVQ